MRYDTVIFDLDGTLVDTLDDLKNAVNHALASKGYPERSRDEIRSFLGDGMALLVRRAAGKDLGEEEFNELFSRFSSYYQAHICDCSRPYPGVPELLRELRKLGVRTAVVTNKRDPAAKKLCRDLFPGLLDAVVGEVEGVPRKPDPAPVARALSLLGGGSSVYLGDSEVDVVTARNAGLDLVAVTWGFRKRETLIACGAERLIDRPADLLRYL